MNIYLFWFIQLSWGIVINLFGLLITVILLCLGIKPERYNHAVYFEIGEKWGGVNFGGFLFVQKNASDRLKSHEYGHSFQNLLLGPFMIFAVTIPSAIRYHVRNIQAAKGIMLKPYDDFWCESWATRLGEKHSKCK
ncbi:hypothetical protein [Jeotgalibacillus haloalkalitolerans]|uniref:Uncharacterized protein n=1 Tax=Jeotgalibacillus haloalkalitolerans TaxID=3104292 RepID=A0ABU5KNY4_9BACL|nr:hypothetical protein [Jeotgalibacillus sp. HH7-29]MDZ5712973.1 hypothetical protein [Jeotgalibacillus sp. HH7-29]